MNKKNLTILIIAIIIVIIASIFFIFTKSQNKSENSTNTNSTSNQKTNKVITELTFFDSENKKYTLSDFSDKPIALILWNSDSENSLDIIELVEQYYEQYKEQINFLVVNTNEPLSNILETVNNINFTIPIYYDKDSTSNKFYNFEKLPTLIFFEEDGTTSNQIEGKITEDSYTANLDIIAHNY